MNGNGTIFDSINIGASSVSRLYELFISGYFDNYIFWMEVIGWGISAFILFWTIYALVKLVTIRKAEKQKLIEAGMQAEQATKPNGNKKWERIQAHINSKNPSDWRLAILEADIILEEMLDKLGYPGTTIGDKLKAVNRGDFKSIDSAWEAHKVRNAIAHEGSDFQITERETRRVIGQFEEVFKEFKQI